MGFSEKVKEFCKKLDKGLILGSSNCQKKFVFRKKKWFQNLLTVNEQLRENMNEYWLFEVSDCDFSRKS